MISFIFSINQAFAIELGHFTMRVFQGFSLVESSPGVTLVVDTPWDSGILKELHLRQRGDIIYVTHNTVEPTGIKRFANDDWRVEAIALLPEPASTEPTDLDAVLTPGALSGSDVLFTADSAVFLDGDVDRIIAERNEAWIAVISALETDSPSTAVRATILKPLTSLAPVPAGEWFLLGHPNATLATSALGPEGALTTLTLERVFEDATNLMVNGNFSLGSTGWTDYSGALVVTGTHDGGQNQQDLEDSGTDFVVALAEVGHRVLNLSDVSEGRLNAITTTTNPNDTLQLNPGLSGGGDNDWDTGDAYEVRQTGTFATGAGEGRLSGGENGKAWAENEVSGIEVGKSYHIRFTVRENAVALQVGSAAQLDDIRALSTFSVQLIHEITVTATTTSLFVQFENNQDGTGVMDNVVVFLAGIDGWRSQDIGRYVQVRPEGYAEILSVTDASTAQGLIWVSFIEAQASVENWDMFDKAFSPTNGYPASVEFFENRLWLGGTPTYPLRFWASATGRFTHFDVGVQDDNGLFRELAGGELNAIQWMLAARDGLLMGSASSEHIVTSNNGGITPSNIAQRLVSSNGSNLLQPLLAEDLLFLLSRSGQRMLVRTLEQTNVSVQQTEVTALIGDLLSGGIEGWTLERDPGSRVWLHRFDGTAFGLTFDQNEQMKAWHTHRSQGVYESGTVIPVSTEGSSESEQLWWSVIYTINGETKRYIEVWRPDDTITTKTSQTQVAAHTVDSALSYTGTPAVTTFGGLKHLEGETVELVERGTKTTVDPDSGRTFTVTTMAALGPQVVVDAQVTTNHPIGGDVGTSLDVGLGFTSTLRTLPVEIPTESGTSQTRRKRWQRLFARLVGSQGLVINGKDVAFRKPEEPSGPRVPETLDVNIAQTGWLDRGVITIQQRLPLPSIVLSIFGDLDIEDSD